MVRTPVALPYPLTRRFCTVCVASCLLAPFPLTLCAGGVRLCCAGAGPSLHQLLQGGDCDVGVAGAPLQQQLFCTI